MADLGTVVWPPSSASTNPSVGLNGQTAPTSSTEVGGINPSGNLQPLQTDNSGNLYVAINAEPDSPLSVQDVADGSPGAAAPAKSIQVAGSDGTDLRTISTTTTGQVNVAQSSAAALNATVVQGTAANLLAQVSQPTASSLNATVVQGTAANLLAQVSQPTASNLNATVVQGTAANLLAQVSQPTAASLNATVVQGTASALNATVVGAGSAGTPSGGVVSIQGVASGTNVPISGAVTTTATDLTASGSITTQNLNPNSGTATANSTVAITLNGQSVLSIQVTGTYTGALTPQASIDGSDWVAISSVMNANTGAFSATITSASVGIWQAGVAAFNKFRISANAAVTGTAVITIQASIAPGQVAIDVPLPAGTNIIGALSANQSVNVAQIAGTAPTVKAASTAAVAGDTALVIAISPNNKAIIQTGNGTLTDGSGTCSATPSTATTLMASNANRKYLLIQNTGTGTIWFNFTTTAVTSQPSFELTAGASFVQEAGFVSTEAISVISTTASAPYAAKQA